MTIALVVVSFAAYRFISRVQPNGPDANALTKTTAWAVPVLASLSGAVVRSSYSDRLRQNGCQFFSPPLQSRLGLRLQRQTSFLVPPALPLAASTHQLFEKTEL